MERIFRRATAADLEQFLKIIDERSGFDADEILRIEAEVKHDMIAFDTNMADHVGPEGRYIHLGLTSSDVEDTASALRIKQSLEIVIKELDVFMKDVMEQALKYKYTPSVARSHGVHAGHEMRLESGQHL